MALSPAIFAQPRRAGLACLITVGLGQAGTAAIAAFATRALFSGLDDPTLPWGPLLAMAAAAVITAGLTVTARVLAEGLGHSYARDLRRALYITAAREPMEAVANRRPGAASLRFVGDLTAIRGWVSRGLAGLISAILVLPASTVILWLVHPSFLGPALALVATTGIGIALLGPSLPPLHQSLRRARSRLAADLSERLRQAPSLDLLGRRKRDLDLIDSHSWRIRDLARTRAHRQELLAVLPELVAAWTGVACAILTIRHGLPAADLAAALAALGLTLMPLRELTTLVGRYAAFQVAMRACERGLARPPRHFPPASADPTTPSLQMRAPLTLLRADQSPLDLAPGTHHWGTGAGMPLFQDTLCGSFAAPGNWIRLGGHDIATMSQGARRLAVHQLSPDTPILSGSLRRALTLGLDERPPEHTLAALLDAFDLNAYAPKGLDTRLSEGGLSLPTSARTALRLARAAASRAPLIVISGTDRFMAEAGPDAMARFCSLSNSALLFDSPLDPSMAPFEIPPPQQPPI